MPSRRTNSPPGPGKVAGPVALVLICLAMAAPAHAEPEVSAGNDDQVALAERHAADAYAAYRDKRFAEAVSLYQKAYGVVPSAEMLYNVARIYDLGLKDRPLAITFYRRYVADPGADADLIRKANERLTALKQAEAALVESPVATAPASAPHHAPAPGQDGDVPFWTGWRVAAAVAGAAGVVALGVGTGFGVAALSEADTVDRLCDGNECRSQEGVDAVSTAESHATIATTAFAAGGALIVTSAAIFLFDSGGPPERDSHSRLTWTPVATPSRVGLSLSGRF